MARSFYRAVAALVVLAPLVGAPGVSAQVTQVVSNTEAGCFVFAPVASADGTVVAFESNCDLLGGNSDHNREIFTVDRSVPSLAQITDTTGCANTNPSIDDDGTKVAFDSDCDLSGENGDGNVEIFYWNGTMLTQLTSSTICGSLAPSINAAGTIVAFDSNCDLIGSNIDLSNEIFTATAAGVITQITDDATSDGCGSFNASIDAAGATIAFESDCDLAGSNIDGITEIFRAVVGGAVTQLTADPDDAGCASGNASIDAAGSLVAFESDCDFAGANADGEPEIYRVDAQGAVEQLTDDDGASACESTDPSITPDGTAVVYVSSCDPLGTNVDGNLEIFEAATIASIQHTSTMGCNSFEPFVVSMADVVTFAGDCEFGSGNAANVDQAYSLYTTCACGAPLSRNGGSPVATDALFALSAAIQLAACGPCSCDVDASGTVTAADALRILNAAVGMNASLSCP